MIKVRKNTKGIVLAEALIAVVVLMTGAVVVSSIIKRTLETNSLSRDYLIAHNLATEGIEAIKSLRSSNWIKCGDGSKWLHEKVNTNCDNASGELLANDSTYVVYFDSNLADDDIYGWQLGDVNFELDLEDNDEGNESYRIYLIDGEYLAFNPDGDAPEAGTETSKFYRMLKAGSDAGNANEVDFEMIIQWKHKNKKREIVRPFKLYNLVN